MNNWADRFWAKVDRTGDCWLWTRSLATQGYGRASISLGGNLFRREVAHRVAYELVKGPIPEGLVLDHLCRNRGCVNPDHLEAVTQRENVLRGVGFAAQNAVKTHCPQGHDYAEHGRRRANDGGRDCTPCVKAAGDRFKLRRRIETRMKRRGWRASVKPVSREVVVSFAQESLSPTATFVPSGDGDQLVVVRLSAWEREVGG